MNGLCINQSFSSYHLKLHGTSECYPQILKSLLKNFGIETFCKIKKYLDDSSTGPCCYRDTDVLYLKFNTDVTPEHEILS